MDIELDEASLRRRKNVALIIDLKEENGLENKNTDDELNGIESSEIKVGEPANVPTNVSTSELNNSIDHTDKWRRKKILSITPPR